MATINPSQIAKGGGRMGGGNMEHSGGRDLFVESGLGEEVTELGGPVLERRVALDLLLGRGGWACTPGGGGATPSH